SLKTSIKTITYLSDTGCLEIQGASLECVLSSLSMKKIVSEIIMQIKRCKGCNKLSWVQTAQVCTFLF
ncbi:hypothetical protein, partial [Escherichia coli]|uniref:hypothetical protein n=1 Tax=Escherichia coli TaxID=562 RepID=UPI003CED1AC3